MIEKEIKFKSNDVQLCGTLTLPESKGPSPAVLLIPGSGQIDRNENHKKMHLNVFGEMAAHFADIGIASLRYDKRGVSASEGDYWSTGFHDNIKDAANAFKFLKAQPEIESDKTFILGHSEGAYISMRLAGSLPDIAGVILLAGGPRSGEEELIWQAQKVAEGMTGFNKWLIKLLRVDVANSQKKYIEKIKNSGKDVMRVQIFSKINARWMREMLSYNPKEDLQKISCPVLAITGEKDIQVDPNGLEVMSRLVKSKFEYHVPPNVTHLLRAQEGEAGISTYGEQIKKPIDAKLVKLTLNWLKRNK